MRKIYVLDKNNELKEIDSGISSYAELTDAPISTSTLNTEVSVINNDIIITPVSNHR